MKALSTTKPLTLLVGGACIVIMVAFTFWHKDTSIDKVKVIGSHYKRKNIEERTTAINTSYGSIYVTSLLTDSCLVSVFERATLSCLSNYISDLFAYSYKGSQTTFHLFIAESSAKDDSGWTDPSTSNPNELTININKNKFPSASQEFWTSVLGHEIIHSFILINNLAPSVKPGVSPYRETTHEMILKSWIIHLTNFIQTCHPSLSRYDALGLAVDGLEDVTTGQGYESDTQWDNFIQKHYNMSITEAKQAGDAYAYGGYGTICP